MQVQTNHLTAKKQRQPFRDFGVQLRAKKKDTVERVQQAKKEVESYLRQVSLIIMEHQSIVTKQLDSKLCDFCTQIDRYLPMSEGQWSFYSQDIEALLTSQFQIICQPLTQWNKFLNKSCQVNRLHLMESNQIETQKKLLSIKANNDEEIIEKLQEKIESMMLGQEKLKERIKLLQSKKKVRQSQESKFNNPKLKISSLLVERIEEEKKILGQINKQSTARMQQLIEENTNLKQQLKKYSSKVHFMSVTDNNDSCHIESSVERSSAVATTSRVTKLDNTTVQIHRIQELARELEHCRETIQQQSIQYEKLLRQCESIQNSYQTVSRDYELCCRSKVKNEESYLSCNNKLIELERVYQQLLAKNNHLSADNENLKTLNQHSSMKIEELNEITKQFQSQIRLNHQSYIQRKEELQSQLQNYMRLHQEHQSIIHNLQTRQGETQRNYSSKFTQMLSENQTILKLLEQKERQMQMVNNQMRESQVSALKMTREKETTQKKEFNKKKKDIEKQLEDQKKQLKTEFQTKFGELEQRVWGFRNQIIKLQQQHDSRSKIFQGRLRIMKESCIFQINELLEKNKLKLTTEIIEKHIDGQATAAFKASQIKQLKQQIAILKKQKREPNCIRVVGQKIAEMEIFEVEKQLIQCKGQADLEIINQKLTETQEALQLQKEQKQVLEQKLVNQKETNRELKSELKKLTEKGARIQSIEQLKDKQEQNKKKLQLRIQKFESQIKSLKNIVKKVNSELSDLQMELKSKKDLIAKYKEEINKKQQESNNQKVLNDQQNKQMEKLNKRISDVQVKQQLYASMKEKYEQMKLQQKEYQSLKKVAQDRERKYKFELSQKDQAIRALKEEREDVKQDKNNLNLEQLAELKEKVRKMKCDIDRKDQLLKRAKHKADEDEQENRQKVKSAELQIGKLSSQVETLQRKLDSSKISMKKHESKNIILFTLIRRLYEKLWKNKAANKDQSMNQYMSTRQQESPDQAQQYEGLSIIDIPSSLLAKYLTPRKPAIYGQNIEIDKLERHLQKQDIDVKAILEQFDTVLLNT